VHKEKMDFEKLSKFYINSAMGLQISGKVFLFRRYTYRYQCIPGTTRLAGITSRCRSLKISTKFPEIRLDLLKILTRQ